jgi:hypothetical protein
LIANQKDAYEAAAQNLDAEDAILDCLKGFSMAWKINSSRNGIGIMLFFFELMQKS